MSTRRRPHSYATAEDMESCRLLGHAWFPFDTESRPGHAWAVILKCDRCTTRRRDLIEGDGTIYSRSYEYVDGYRDAGHFDSKADRRLAFWSAKYGPPEPERRLRSVKKKAS